MRRQSQRLRRVPSLRAEGPTRTPDTPRGSSVRRPGLPRPGLLLYQKIANPTGSRCSRLIVIEHKQPYGRRKVRVFAVDIDTADQIGQRLPFGLGDIFQAFPERILKTDARLVSSKDDRAFHNSRFHGSSPLLAASGYRITIIILHSWAGFF